MTAAFLRDFHAADEDKGGDVKVNACINKI